MLSHALCPLHSNSSYSHTASSVMLLVEKGKENSQSFADALVGSDCSERHDYLSRRS